MCGICCGKDLHLGHFKGVEMGEGIGTNLYLFYDPMVFWRIHGNLSVGMATATVYGCSHTGFLVSECIDT